MNKFIHYLVVILLYILNNTIGIFINNYFKFDIIDNYIFALFLYPNTSNLARNVLN